MKTKPLTFILILFFQLVSITVFSQKTAVLNSLLDKNSEFIFPQTTDKISKALNMKPVFYEDANGEKYAKWPTKTGLELYCSLGKTKFSKYNAKTQKLGADSEFPRGSKLIFKKGKHYATLFFDNKNLLKSLGLTTELIDPAAN